MSHGGLRSTLSEPVSSRIEVRPPSLRHAPSSRWHRLLFWLLAPAPHDAAPPIERLPAVRSQFSDCLIDVQQPGLQALRARIEQARSLRELWHLRAELYRLVSLQHTQWEAERRIAGLNHHFPTRAPRPGVPVGAA